MPRGDGKGSLSGSRSQGRGRMGGSGLGLGGMCVCPQCGKIVPHKRGEPCNQVKCTQCGVNMTRVR